MPLRKHPFAKGRNFKVNLAQKDWSAVTKKRGSPLAAGARPKARFKLPWCRCFRALNMRQTTEAESEWCRDRDRTHVMIGSKS
jgi:hypothetical protein